MARSSGVDRTSSLTPAEDWSQRGRGTNTVDMDVLASYPGIHTSFSNFIPNRF